MFPNKVPGTAALLEFDIRNLYQLTICRRFYSDIRVFTWMFVAAMWTPFSDTVDERGKPLSAIIFTEFKFEEFRQLSVEKITAVSCSDTLLSYLFGHQWQLPVNMSWMISPWGAEQTLQMKSGRLSTRKSSSTCNKVQEWVTYHLPTTELQVS